MQRKMLIFLLSLLVLPLSSCGQPKVDPTPSEEIKEIHLNVNQLSLLEGESYTFTLTSNVSLLSFDKFEFKSSNATLLSVDTITVIALKEGNVEYSVIYKENRSIKDVCRISISAPSFDFNVSPLDNSDVCLANESVKNFADDYFYGASRPYQGKGDIYYPKDVQLTWSNVNEASYYEVELSKSNNMSNLTRYLTFSNKLTLSDLFIDTSYYWKILAYDTNSSLIESSKVNMFHTLHYPRTLSIEGVSNSRDLGGKITSNGKTIKQGMIYRMANLDNITDSGIRKALYTYNVKTDLDLRNEGEGLYKYSPLGQNVNYINIPGCYWIGGANGLDVESNWKSRMLRELQVFTNPNNYPIAFHCAIGQDRTGSLAFVLGALLGINAKELGIDYELSSFSSAVWDPANPIYVEDKLQYQYMPLYNYIDSFGNQSNSLMEKAELYVKQVGLTQQEITQIRNIMWED